MDTINLIRFNDDNHSERIFINGKYVGTIGNIKNIIRATIDIAKDLNDDYKIVDTEIYVCDDFDDYEEDSEIVDNICEFFYTTEQMTEEQIKAVMDKDWQKLNTISKE